MNDMSATALGDGYDVTYLEQVQRELARLVDKKHIVET